MRQLVGVVGFRGYSGAELVKILAAHRRVEPVLLEHRQDGDDPRPFRLPKGLLKIPCRPELVAEHSLAAVFLATPPEVSMELTRPLLETGAKVIDLSGAFRLRTAERYAHWYKEQHTDAGLLAEAVYGLPEFYREQIRGARLISNPGCYPTAANLAIRPLIRSGLLDRSRGLICDAKSGVSGAGRKPSLKTSFCEVTENFSLYSILNHRHVPEVLLNSGLEEEEFSFTAHLLPVDRGILETIYCRTSVGKTTEDLLSAYRQEYAAEPFIRIYPQGHMPDLLSVAHTNFCDIGVTVAPASGRVVVASAIDNLVKGAAGQAIQNMNLCMGFAETEGLL